MAPTCCTELEATRRLVYDAAWRYPQDPLSITFAPVRIGNGARAAAVAANASEVMRDIIVRSGCEESGCPAIGTTSAGPAGREATWSAPRQRA